MSGRVESRDILIGLLNPFTVIPATSVLYFKVVFLYKKFKKVNCHFFCEDKEKI